jgi:polyphosphate kinase 2
MNPKAIEDFYTVKPEHVHILYGLQVELLKLQKHIKENNLRLAILFEGRDTAGKGSAISRFSQFLNPQLYRTVALGKPTQLERGQWYFQRYMKQLPNAGCMAFFDRSWYNRAVVEPVMGFCTQEQYDRFMHQVNDVERMLVEDGLRIVKLWFSIDMTEQAMRIAQRLQTPLIQWKVSPVDLAAQEKWEDFTIYKNNMYRLTSTDQAPWMIVRGDSREHSRIQAMKYVLSLYDYEDKDHSICIPDPAKIKRWSE